MASAAGVPRTLDIARRWLEALAQDARFAMRTLLRNRGFAATVVATLALGTGATTAIFTVVNSVVLRPLPFAEPDRLVRIYGRAWGYDRGEQAPDPMHGPVGSLELEAYAQSRSFAGLAGYSLSTRHLTAAVPERLTAVVADHNFFTVLGVDAVRGRTFRPGDPQDVAVISARLWRRMFGEDPAIAGRTVLLDGRRVTVLGVMPDAFQFPYSAGAIVEGAQTESRTDLWVPMEPLRAGATGTLRRGRVDVIARLGPGVAIAAAEAELRVVAHRLAAQSGDSRVRIDARLVSVADDVIGPVRRSLWMLFAAVALVLAAACANVGNLLLGRLAVRAREVATRASLGATRRRLVAQFLVESLMLALAGGLAGLVIARWGTMLLVAVASATIPRSHEIAIDRTAFAFLLLACGTTAVVFGLAPAVMAARLDINDVMKQSGAQTTMGRRYGRLRDALVVVEVALGFVLALGAAVVIREVLRLEHVPTGMITDNVLTLHVTPRAPAADYYAIEERARVLPNVQAAGFTQLVPLQNWGWEAEVAIRGRPPEGRLVAELRYVTPGYFRALGIPVMRGRGFTGRDSAEAPPVVMINEAFARRYFRDRNPIGREIEHRGTIVGVAGDVRQGGLDREAVPELFYPAAQNLTMASDIGMTLIVRSSEPPAAMTEALRAAVRGVNPALAVFNVKTMEQVVADSLWRLNLYRWLIGLFAAVALALAGIGVYGVISYSVASRKREFAVRLALGSAPARLARLVIVSAVRLAGLGLAAGVVIALAVAPSLKHLTVRFDHDPAMYAVVAAVLVAIALAASLLPALRVAHVNPAAALRHD